MRLNNQLGGEEMKPNENVTAWIRTPDDHRDTIYGSDGNPFAEAIRIGLEPLHATVPIGHIYDIKKADFILRAVNNFYPMVESLKETNEACAACFRVISKAGLVDELEKALKDVGVKNGFGVKANLAISKAEGGAE